MESNVRGAKADGSRLQGGSVKGKGTNTGLTPFSVLRISEDITWERAACLLFDSHESAALVVATQSVVKPAQKRTKFARRSSLPFFLPPLTSSPGFSRAASSYRAKLAFLPLLFVVASGPFFSLFWLFFVYLRSILRLLFLSRWSFPSFELRERSNSLLPA